jgi:hypothetical protein
VVGMHSAEDKRFLLVEHLLNVGEYKIFPTFLAEKLIDRHVVSPLSCAILDLREGRCDHT